MSREEEEEEQQQELTLATSFSEREQHHVKRSFGLPLDLVLRIIDFLPSPVLFSSRLCKAAHERALLVLAHRPFFILQQVSELSLCYLLPLDSPSTPLPGSFKLAKPSFQLALACGNLLCLRRQYPCMLDICVCNIFRRWKVTLPPIVHPSLAPRLLRRVFIEDCNVDSLSIVGFHVQPIIDPHAVFCPEYRVFVASNLYLRVYDSHTQQWSNPVYFPSHCSSQIVVRSHLRTPPPPQCFATFDGNLILTFSATKRALFKYEDQSFHDMQGLPFHPIMELAGYPASACVNPSFNLEISLPHVEGNSRSTVHRGLELKDLCRSEHGRPCEYALCVSDQRYPEGYHKHIYTRQLCQSHCFAYQGKVYALVVEKEEMQCNVERTMVRDKDVVWHTISTGDFENILHNQDAGFNCKDYFPRHSPRKLTLYSGCVDMTNWTMCAHKEADASAFLDYLGNEGNKIAGMLLLG